MPDTHMPAGIDQEPFSRADGARVGPNAVIQTAEALAALEGEGATAVIFGAAGLAHYLASPPASMVAESEAARLHHAVFAHLPPDRARAASAEAGRRTGDYILAHRLPGPVQHILKLLPPKLSAKILMKAIEKHACTFAGSRQMTGQAGAPCVIEIANNPLATPDCPWHSAVFERLFQELVTPRARVTSTACCHRGDPVCRFVITLDGRRAS